MDSEETPKPKYEIRGEAKPKFDLDELQRSKVVQPGLMLQKLLSVLIEKNPDEGYRVAAEYQDVFALVGDELLGIEEGRRVQAIRELMRCLDQVSPNQRLVRTEQISYLWDGTPVMFQMWFAFIPVRADGN